MITDEQVVSLREQWAVRANLARMSGLLSIAEAIEQCARDVERENARHQERAIASRHECGCSVWPCPTCGAVDMEDAGNKCRGDWVCAADDQRQLDYEREQSTPNDPLHAPRRNVKRGQEVT